MATMHVSISTPGLILTHVGNLTGVCEPVRFIRVAAMRGGWMNKSVDLRRTFKNKDPNP